mgnify:CR=1 FL=1
MGTCAALQRMRTARARLVLVMLLENEGDFVQLACHLSTMHNLQQLLELRSCSQRSQHVLAERQPAIGAAGLRPHSRRRGWRALSARARFIYGCCGFTGGSEAARAPLPGL